MDRESTTQDHHDAPSTGAHERAGVVFANDGVRLRVDVVGVGEPTMVLLNGLFCSTHYFEPMVAHFASRCRVVAWDYAAHGQSGDVPNPSSLGVSRFAEDATRVLDAVAREPVVIVGHSMGVRVALELYARAPERVRALVLLCGSVDGSLGPGLDRVGRVLARALASDVAVGRSAERMKDLATRTDIIPLLGYAVGGMSRERTPREPIDALLRNIRRMQTSAIVNLARSYLVHSARNLVAQVRVPTLVIAGERDRLATPEHCEVVAAGIPGAELWIAPRCTHLALVEDPQGVNDRIERFLAPLQVAGG